MLQDIVVTGMILAVQPVGEYDRRVVLLTKERGKISAFAKGARRQSSGLLAATAPFCFGKFHIYEGRNSYTIRQAEIQLYFETIRSDLEGAWYGMYFLELADYYGRENEDGSQMLNLLYVTLKAIEKNVIERPLIKVIFELKAMVLSGEYPDFFHCRSCGKTEDLNRFQIEQDGMLCHACEARRGHIVIVDASSLYTLQYIVSADMKKLYSFMVTASVYEQIFHVISQCKKKYIGKEFQSEKLLEEIRK